MTDPEITADIRQRVAREICAREGHGDLTTITSYGDLPFDRRMCGRGCGAEIYEEYRGPVTARAVTDLLAKLDGKNVRIRRIEIIVEDAQ